MEFLAGKVFAQWSIKNNLPEPERLAAESLVNKLGLRQIKDQEALDFALEWIADKAKNSDEAAKALFNTIFWVSPLMAKIYIRCWGSLVTRLAEPNEVVKAIKLVEIILLKPLLFLLVSRTELSDARRFMEKPLFSRWYTACLSARLDRQAIAKVIGENALRWLEDERTRQLAERSLRTP